MSEESKIVDLNLIIDEEIAALFRKATAENGFTAKDVLENFMKDYIVSGCHPKKVVNNWP